MKRNLFKMNKVLPVLVLVGLLVGALALAFPSGSVAAQGANPPAQPTPTTPGAAANNQARQQRVDARLERLYQRGQKQVTAQAKRLTTIDTRLTKIEQRIANMKSQGKDVTALEAALADFKKELTVAHTAHDSAAAIFNTHAGFDTNGKVTNVQLARDTVQQASTLLKQAHQDVVPPLKELVQTIRQYIRDNRKK